MGVCGRCDKIIADGARICFDCMFDLAEEERIERLKARPGGTFYSWTHPFVTPGRANRICDHCWPFDCGCF